MDLLVPLDRDGPLQDQVEQAIREGIRAGRLPAGGRLPSTRALSAELGVSRGVVSGAYEQLAAEGYLHTRQGAPVRIARGISATTVRPPAQPLTAPVTYDFDPGRPDLAGFPRDRWMRALRAAWRESPIEAIGHGDPRGTPELRDALADHLGRVRGAVADPEHVLVCTGFRQAFSLVCRWLAAHGVARVALEDPGWHPHRLIAEQAGLEPVPVAVDELGVCVEALEEADVQAVVVTPAHQFPAGPVLAPMRRTALIDWAERREALIVEDDYDAQLRHDRVAVGALQGLAPEHVVYIGSASKLLAPGLRLGWMLAPSWAVWPLVAAKAVEDAGSETAGQLALAHLITTNDLDRHVRRMRLRYRARRAALVRALATHLPDARPSGHAAGLFELVHLPAGVDEAAAVAAAAERGTRVEGLELHRFEPGGAPALVLGFGGLAEPAIEEGVRRLAQAVQPQARSTARFQSASSDARSSSPMRGS